jgi:hypothetical protein
VREKRAYPRAKEVAEKVGCGAERFPQWLKAQTYLRSNSKGKGKSRSFDSGGKYAAFAQDGTSLVGEKRTSNGKGKSRSSACGE